MARANSNRKSSNREERQYLEVDSWDVERARSTRGGVYFSLKLNGVTINNCRIARSHDDREFIGFPQYKGSDGNYYSCCYAPIDDDLQREIIKIVYQDISEARRGN